MALPLAGLVALDALAALLLLGVAGFFVASWRRSGEPLHLLFAVGFGLVALGISAVFTAQFDLARRFEAWDALRLVGHTGGALVLALAYGSARLHGVARPARVLGWAAAAVAVLVALLYVALPPAFDLPNLADAFAAAHAVQFVAYLACVGLSLEGFRRAPTLENAFVPAAFLAYAFSKWTWLLIDLTADLEVVPFVLLWRFTAIGLLLAAVLSPFRPRGGAHGPS